VLIQNGFLAFFGIAAANTPEVGPKHLSALRLTQNYTQMGRRSGKRATKNDALLLYFAFQTISPSLRSL
jgi:hypothetical protein